jgi:hypothetical protein
MTTLPGILELDQDGAARRTDTMVDDVESTLEVARQLQNPR